MKPDLVRVVLLTAGWAAVTLGSYFIILAVLPGTEPMAVSLWVIALMALLVAGGVSALGWWGVVGFTPPHAWRDSAWLAVPAVLTLLPLVAGVKPLAANMYVLLIAGYALTGFAEETMFRGILVRLLERHSPMVIAAITAILFGLVHLSNIFIRGEPAIIAAQAVGAAAFGFGYAALRMRTNALVPLIVTHMLTDLFLQMGSLPLIPVAVVQDVVLFALGLYLLRRPAAS
ncbi:MAG TPA: CPBP family intramembrane glutamic endopeptidase [Devosia sp.]|nr:CPBP family intramembrane glutamic endopeptidase [Devosia sp.]